MEKSLKQRIKRYVLLAFVAVLVVLLAIMPMLAGEKAENDGPVASILTDTASLNSISTVVKGGGTLEGEEALEITIPAGVLLKSFLVQNDAVVREGDPVAEVDRVSVMNVITQVQETLDYLTEQIENTRDEEISKTISATAGGLVKHVYAQPGDRVQDVMLRHGALAVVSLDGLMAVEFSTEAALSVGDGVKVTFEDGTQTEGVVESSLDGTVVITLEDEGYAADTQVNLSNEDGRLGIGTLYIHSKWNVTGYSGTVSAVHVKEGAKISAGKTFFTLTDTSFTAEFDTLVGQRQEYEDMMLELFQLYQNTTVNAPGDGRISGVDEDSAYLLSDSGNQGWVLNFLSEGPSVNLLYTNYVAQVADVAENGWTLKVNQTPAVVIDYASYVKDYSSVGGFDQETPYIPSQGVQIYALENEEWVTLTVADIAAGDELMFVFDNEGNVVWIICLSAEKVMPEAPEMEGTAPPAETETPAETEPTPENPSMGGTGYPGGMTGYPGGMGSISGIMGGYQEEETFETYSLQKNVIMTVTPECEVTLSITVDESDIAKLFVGQEAQIRLDALRNDRFTGTITELGSSGENNGGSSKFTVVITMDRSEKMLAGMNATATIVLDTQENLLSIPVAALYEEGDRTFVYTSYDAEKETFGTPVDVEVGISDGQYVQILSGLQEGDAFWYAYYDTLDISTDVAPDNPMGFSMMGM